MKVIQTLLSFLVLIIIILSVSSPNWGRTEYTTYFVYCPEYGELLRNCKNKEISSFTTYKAIPETQTIITKGLLLKYKNCTVYDAQNWQCEEENIMNGTLVPSDPSDILDPKIQQISRPYYIYYQFLEFIRAILPTSK